VERGHGNSDSCLTKCRFVNHLGGGLAAMGPNALFDESKEFKRGRGGEKRGNLEERR